MVSGEGCDAMPCIAMQDENKVNSCPMQLDRNRRDQRHGIDLTRGADGWVRWEKGMRQATAGGSIGYKTHL